MRHWGRWCARPERTGGRADRLSNNGRWGDSHGAGGVAVMRTHTYPLAVLLTAQVRQVGAPLASASPLSARQVDGAGPTSAESHAIPIESSDPGRDFAFLTPVLASHRLVQLATELRRAAAHYGSGLGGSAAAGGFIRRTRSRCSSRVATPNSRRTESGSQSS